MKPSCRNFTRNASLSTYVNFEHEAGNCQTVGDGEGILNQVARPQAILDEVVLVRGAFKQFSRP